MTAFIAPSVNETQFSGQYGNSSVATGTYTAAAAAINDTVALIKLYAGSKITGARLVTGALGAGTTVDFGFVNVDGSAGGQPAQFLSGQSTAATGSFNSATRPFTLAKDAFVQVTFKGGPATGFVDAIIEYEFRGQ